jgi:dynein light intermediate chain
MTRNEPPETLIKHEAAVFVGVDAIPEGSSFPRKGVDPAASQLDDMVNSMLPPREWTQESGTWMQFVSKEPATRLDVITLQELLDKRLETRQAREADICPVREDLYHQCFDELIRQVTLDGPERGLLLLRVRDELRMTIDAYKILVCFYVCSTFGPSIYKYYAQYESSITFGVRKQLLAEQGRADLEDSVITLEHENKGLEVQVAELRNKLEVIEKRGAERKALEDKKRKEEIDFLKHQGQHLDSFLRQLGGNK